MPRPLLKVSGQPGHHGLLAVCHAAVEVEYIVDSDIVQATDNVMVLIINSNSALLARLVLER